MHALEGLKVVDLSPTQAGGQVTQLLADFGAEVVWVEAPGGAPLRRQRSFPFVARGKSSIEADLRQPGDRAAILSLIDRGRHPRRDLPARDRRADRAQLRSIGAAEPALDPRIDHRLRPRRTTRRRSRLRGARRREGGRLLCLPGHAQRPPSAVRHRSVLLFAASQIALHGIFAALLERARSGSGQHVGVNLVQAFSSLDTWGSSVQVVNQKWPDAYPSAEAFDEEGRPNSPLMFMLLSPLTRDGRWIQFAEVAPHLYAAMIKALGLGWILEDPDWAVGAARRGPGAEVAALEHPARGRREALRRRVGGDVRGRSRCLRGAVPERHRGARPPAARGGRPHRRARISRRRHGPATRAAGDVGNTGGR